jgi:hypothetical protein
MARWGKILWAAAAGVALVAGGCGSCAVAYGPPEGYDASVDIELEPVDDAVDETVDDVEEDEMPAGAYGPPPDM